MSSQVQSFAPAPRQGFRAYLRFWVTLLAVLAADQGSKAWIEHHIEAGTYFNPPPFPVIDGFFYFVNVTNSGAAWGMFSNHTILLALLGFAALGAIYFFRRQLELAKPLLQYTFGMLCGGILGNLIDREVKGRVVDFWDFHLWHGYRFPAFNVADSFITIGVTIYLFYSFRDSWPRQRNAQDTNAADSATKPSAN